MVMARLFESPMRLPAYAISMLSLHRCAEPVNESLQLTTTLRGTTSSVWQPIRERVHRYDHHEKSSVRGITCAACGHDGCKRRKDSAGDSPSRPRVRHHDGES